MVDSPVGIIVLEILLDGILVAIQLVRQRFGNLRRADGVLLLLAHGKQLLVSHMDKTDTAVELLLLILGDRSQLKARCASCSVLPGGAVVRPVCLPESVFVRRKSCLCVFLRLLGCLRRFRGGFLLLFLFLCYLRFVEDAGREQRVPVLLWTADAVFLGCFQALVIPELQVPVDQLEELALVVYVQLVVLAKAAHPLEWQSQQELAGLLVVDDLFDVELNDGLTCLDDRWTVKL